MTLTATQHAQIRDAIQAEMSRLGYNQRRLAAKLNLDPSTVSKYLSGDLPITPDVIRKISVALGSLPLRQIYAAVAQAGVAAQEYMSAIDLTPAVVQAVLLVEMDEAASALRPVRLVNRRTAEDLPTDSREALTRAIDQLLDVKAGIEHFLIACHAAYGIDPDQACVRWSAKVRGRGYVRARGTNLVPMLPAGVAAGGRAGGCA